MSREQKAFGAMISLRMKCNLKLKGKRKKEIKIDMNSSGKEIELASTNINGPVTL